MHDAPNVVVCPNLMPPLTSPTQSTISITLSPKPIDLTSDALIKETIVQL
jgi:hypothetical protein